MPLRYAVEPCPNDAKALHLKLNEAADNGGRVVNVMWQPEHEVVDRSTCDDVRIKVDPGYVIILEYFEAEP